MQILYVVMIFCVTVLVVIGSVFFTADQQEFRVGASSLDVTAGLISCKNQAYLELQQNQLYSGGTYTFGSASCEVSVAALDANTFTISLVSWLADGTIREAVTQVSLLEGFDVNYYEEVVQ